MTTKLVRAKAVLGHNRADSILIRDGAITAVGLAASFHAEDIELIDYRGGVIAPALHDHHFHPIGYASAVSGLSLKTALDLEDLLTKVREAADRLEAGQALVGNRLDEESMAEHRLPTSVDLDRVVPERPVLLYRYCGHVAVANTAALRLAGVDGDGILSEDSIQPVSRALASFQPVLDPAAVTRALAGLASLGLTRLTAIVSAGEPLWCGVADEIETLLEVSAGLPLDFDVLVIASSAVELKAGAERLNRGPPNVSFFGWKEFADGSLGGRTAALYEPYTDDNGTAGILRLDSDHALAMARTCIDLGGTVAIHAIGDRANDRVLDVFENLLDQGADAASLRVEHASVLTSEAMDRMARLGITASVQPAFIASEVEWLGKRLGSRVNRTYSLAALAEAGVAMIGGSDCPVESPNPWIGIAAAAGPGGLGPRRAVDLFGKPLMPGGEATFLVVDRDLLATSGIGSTRVIAAFRQGQPLTLVEELPFA